MAFSNSRTPLLGGEEDATPQRCFDRVGHFFALVFARHNLVVATGPLGTLLTLSVSKYYGVGDDGSGGSKQFGFMLGVLMWMAIWWLLEPVPIAVTSLVPLALFPFFGIMSADDVASQYTNDIVSLMLGTFILALAISKYNLHKRMALKILLLAGGEKMSARLVLLGFIVGPAFVSVWMSNTTTAAMMIPMATGLLHNLDPLHHASPGETSPTVTEAGGGEDGTKDADDKKRVDAEEAIAKYSRGVILGITYGTALGGMASLIGTGSTLVLQGMYSERFPNAPEITFLQWMKFGVPVAVVWLLLMWLYFCWLYCPATSVPIIEASLNRSTVEKAYRALGSISFAEIFVLSEFLVLIVLWVTRSFGSSPGWSAAFEGFPNDGTIAVAAAILLFMVPNYEKEIDGEMIMDWKTCKNISWSVILLLGGGFALSKGIEVSGVSVWVGTQMQFLEVVPYYLLPPVISILLHCITEFSSNVAVATLFLPIIAEVAMSMDVHPLLLLVPATFATNSAFILPSGTPPNAIAYGTGYVNIHHMGQPGFFMHILGILILSVATPTLGAYVYGLNQAPSSMPWYFS